MKIDHSDHDHGDDDHDPDCDDHDDGQEDHDDDHDVHHNDNHDFIMMVSMMWASDHGLLIRNHDHEKT